MAAVISYNTGMLKIFQVFAVAGIHEKLFEIAKHFYCYNLHFIDRGNLKK